MTGITRSAAVAFALANLYLLFLTGPLVSPQHQLIFHFPGRAGAIFAPVLLDLFLTTALLLGLLLLVKRHPRAELLLWSALLLPTPLILVETVAAFAGTPPVPALFRASAAFAVLGFLGVALRSSALLRPFRRLRPILTTALGFVSLSGLVILGQLVYGAWASRNLNPPFISAAPPRPAPVAGSPRVVWVILDELSSLQLYGSRAPELSLPNFDRLATTSTLFTNASATALYTRIAVPSLLTGHALTASAPSADGHQLQLRIRGAGHWSPLDAHDTVFGDALRAGLPTGVAGWYEPYCRLLPAVLDRCFWLYTDNIPGNLSPDASLLTNAVAPLRSVASSLNGTAIASDDALDVQRHKTDLDALVRAGDALLTQQGTGLILLHMPIPHPWGFYDRRTGTFPGHRTSYLDNLALADQYLGHLRALLEADGSWDSTDLIIMGDHGWRAHSVWSHSGHWTPEEAAASQNAATDGRPAVIVKLAGQQAGTQITAPFDATRTRALIDALLERRLRSPAALALWVASPRSPSAPPPAR